MERWLKRCGTKNAENVKPRVAVSREDLAEVTSRMEDSNTPVEKETTGTG